MNNPQLAPEVEALFPCPLCGQQLQPAADHRVAGMLEHPAGLPLCPISALCFNDTPEMRALWNRRAPVSIGAVAPEPLTPELRAKIEAVRAGCEGVTPGPWEYLDTGEIWYAVESDDNHTPVAVTDHGDHTGEHIARLDPDFVRQLCDLALSTIPADPSGLASAETEFDGLADPKPSTHPAPADTGQGGRVEELEAALEPFARATRNLRPDHDDSTSVMCVINEVEPDAIVERLGLASPHVQFVVSLDGIKAGDFRRARAALDAGART